MKTMNSMRSFILDEKPHIKEYYKIRKMHGEMIDAMIKYYDDGKFEQKTDAENAFQGGIHLY